MSEVTWKPKDALWRRTHSQSASRWTIYLPPCRWISGRRLYRPSLCIFSAAKHSVRRNLHACANCTANPRPSQAENYGPTRFCRTPLQSHCRTDRSAEMTFDWPHQGAERLHDATTDPEPTTNRIVHYHPGVGEPTIPATTDASHPSARMDMHGLGPMRSLLLHCFGLSPPTLRRSPGAPPTTVT
jgi:hypothetical protein